MAACLLFSAAPAPGKSSLRSKPSPSGLALTSYSYSLERCLAFGAGRGVPFQRSAKSSAMVVGRPPQFCGWNFCLSPGLGQLIRSLSASTSQMCPITMTAAASVCPLPAPPGGKGKPSAIVGFFGSTTWPVGFYFPKRDPAFSNESSES